MHETFKSVDNLLHKRVYGSIAVAHCPGSAIRDADLEEACRIDIEDSSTTQSGLRQRHRTVGFLLAPILGHHLIAIASDGVLNFESDVILSNHSYSRVEHAHVEHKIAHAHAELQLNTGEVYCRIQKPLTDPKEIGGPRCPSVHVQSLAKIR